MDRQMIVGVSCDGRIRVKFIEDAPSDNWRQRLSELSATTSSPFDWIEGPISDAIAARMPPWLGQPLSMTEMGTPPSRPILDPG